MTDTSSETTYCANHPNTPTTLRCNRCNTLICTKCAMRTPVGYRCRNCVRNQQQIFETALWYDYALAVVVAAPLATLLGSLVLSLQFFAIVLAPVVGGIVAEGVRFAVRRRRGRFLSLVAAAGFAVGCVPLIFWPVLENLIMLLTSGGGDILSTLVIAVTSSLISFIWPVAFAILGTSTLYYRLRGISL